MALSGLDGVAWRELWVGDDQDARLLPPLLEQIAAGASTARGALASVRVLVLADQPSEVGVGKPEPPREGLGPSAAGALDRWQHG